MPENRNQDLYFATVVFMVLTIHFFGNSLSYYDLANEIEANCTWSCTSLEEELISESETSGFNSFITSVIMAGLALFFWPKKTYEERKQIQRLREQMAEERTRREERLRRKKEKWRKEQKIKKNNFVENLYFSLVFLGFSLVPHRQCGGCLVFQSRLTHSSSASSASSPLLHLLLQYSRLYCRRR